jgi:transposase
VRYRGGLTDEQWALIEPLLPDRVPRRGGRWTDHRLIIDAVAWRFRGNNAWRDLPECFPPWQTVYHRFSVWAKDGTWHRVLTELQAKADAVGNIDWLVGVDSTIVRAHQHAAGACKNGDPAGEPHDHALGRSRGGLTPGGSNRSSRPGQPLTRKATPAAEGPRTQAQQQVHLHLQQAPTDVPGVHPRHPDDLRRAP